MQAREHQFKVGDKAVYPANGVVEVVSIEELDIAGTRQSFYKLRILDNDSTNIIRVPVRNADKLLRPPVSAKDVREIYEILKERTIVFDKQPWNRRQRGFNEKINSGSVFDVAEVMRDLYCLRAEKNLSTSERAMLEKARKLIVQEIAVSKRKSEARVQAEIEKMFEN